MIIGIVGEICKFNNVGNEYIHMNIDLLNIEVYVTKAFDIKGERFVDVIPLDLKLKRKYGVINRSFRIKCFNHIKEMK